jgi:hypothetical protein
MHPTSRFTGSDPNAGIDHLRAFTITAFVGMAAGLIVAAAMRKARVHWGWAVVGAPLVLLLWIIHWQAGLGGATALLTSAGFGYYWHRDSIERGGSEAREARERLSPIRFGWIRLRERLRQEEADELTIGKTRTGQICRIPFGAHRGVHGLVLGATGSGKTVTQGAIAQAYALAGLPVIVIDPKGDAWLESVLRLASEHARGEFREWTPRGPSLYNPFARGGPTEITDKALAGHRWTEPHYELITQRLLGQVLNTMRAAGEWPPTLSTVVRNMDPERLDALAAKVGGGVADRVSEYVDSLPTRARAELAGGRDRLAVLVESELGQWLDPALGVGPELNLQSALERGDVVYIHLDSDRYPVASRLLAAALVIDLVTLTADLQDGELRGLIVIDEFAAVASEHVSRLFGRARSAGLSILLGTQSLADVRGARPDDPTDTLTEQLITNTAFTIVHRESDPSSAERLAQVAGTDPAWSTTRRVRGFAGLPAGRDGTQTRGREFLINPDDFKRLSIGEAVVINPTAKPPAEIVRIWAPKINLDLKDPRRGW